MGKRIKSAKDRDDISRELFRGKTYRQLQPTEQAQVNERVLGSGPPGLFMPQSREVYRINPRTGDAIPVAPTSGAVAPLLEQPQFQEQRLT